MIRILFFLAVVFLLGLGFSWLAERPGDLIITFGGYRYEVTLMVAAVMVAAVVAAVMILWWLVRSIWTSPYAVARYFRARRRDRGYQALSTGIIAAGAGDGGLARRMGRQAAKLISADQEPLIHLLDAQAALLEGDHETARKTFAVMADDPETRLLGLRGLYLEAERLGEREAARQYAARAAAEAPQLAWAMNAALEAKALEGDWQGALALVEKRKAADKGEREIQARRRAVLLTAKAMEDQDTDPAAARSAALEAHRLQPDFVPAALAAARALFRENDLRRGSRVLETVWKKEPHPQVAELYVHARPGDSTQDRLERARRLSRLRPNHVESELAVARAALAAGAFEEARRAAEAAVRLSPREGAFLLLADIEEAETGDQGRVRHWLGKAVRAPRDPAWVADGVVSEHWAPAPPVTGRLDAFTWRAPMERLGQVLESEEALAALPALGEPAEAREQEADEPAEPAVTLDAAPAPEGGEDKPQAEKPRPSAAREDGDGPTRPAPAPAKDAGPARPPLPDDPGVEPEEKENGSSRYRLF